MKYDVALVCCYNNEELVKGLIDSLERQTVSIQRFIVDNTQNRFSSMSECYNWAVSQAEADVIVFAHQDIVFEDDKTLPAMISLIKEKECVVGINGVDNAGRKAEHYLHMYDFADRREYHTIDEVRRVFSVDECLFGCLTKTAKEVGFDEIICNGWSFYASEFCWHCNTLNIPVMVMPAPGVWHNSQNNPINKAFYAYFDRLAAKYAKHYKILTATYGFMYTAFIPRKLLRLWLRVVRGK